MAILLYNVLVLAGDVAVVGFVRKRPAGAAAAGAVFAGGLGAALLGTLLGGGFFGILGLWAWTIFLHGPLLLGAIGVLLWKPARKTAVAAIALGALTAGVGVDAFFIEPFRLELTRVRVESPKLKRPLRIGVLADLQTDKIGGHEERALRMLLAEKPDLILLPGDYLQTRDPRVWEEARSLFRRVGLAAPLGVYAVQGDVDPPGWPSLFEGLGVRCFERTEAVEVDGLRITGLSFLDGDNPRISVPGVEIFHMVFAHRPDFALGDVKADLLVAGHTHGGQVRLPGIGPLVTLSRIPRAWAAGTTRLEGGRTLVVTRGVGMERGAAPRLRFLCAPEVVVIDLVPATAAERLDSEQGGRRAQLEREQAWPTRPATGRAHLNRGT